MSICMVIVVCVLKALGVIGSGEWKQFPDMSAERYCQTLRYAYNIPSTQKLTLT